MQCNTILGSWFQKPLMQPSESFTSRVFGHAYILTWGNPTDSSSESPKQMTSFHSWFRPFKLHTRARPFFLRTSMADPIHWYFKRVGKPLVSHELKFFFFFSCLLNFFSVKDRISMPMRKLCSQRQYYVRSMFSFAMLTQEHLMTGNWTNTWKPDLFPDACDFYCPLPLVKFLVY